MIVQRIMDGASIMNTLDKGHPCNNRHLSKSQILAVLFTKDDNLCKGQNDWSPCVLCSDFP